MEQLGVPRAARCSAASPRRWRWSASPASTRAIRARSRAARSSAWRSRALLALEPRILVFDEPTTDLDPLGKAEIFDVLAALRGRGCTIVLIEHETDAAERADRLVLMAGRPPRRRRRIRHRAARRQPPRARSACGRSTSTASARRWAGAQRAAALEDAAARLAGRSAAAGAPPPTRGQICAAERRRCSRSSRRRSPIAGGQRALVDVSLAIRARRVRRPHRPERLGQDDAGQVPERPAAPAARARCGCAAPTRGPAAQPRRGGRRLRVPESRITRSSPRRCYEEVAFAPAQLRHRPPRRARPRTRAALAAVGLAGMRGRRPVPARQGRSASAWRWPRCSPCEPAVLILDEPTTGLDYRRAAAHDGSAGAPARAGHDVDRHHAQPVGGGASMPSAAC